MSLHLRLKGEDEICQEDVYEISGVIPDKFLDELISVCKLNSSTVLEEKINDLMFEGMICLIVLNILYFKYGGSENRNIYKTLKKDRKKEKMKKKRVSKKGEKSG